MCAPLSFLLYFLPSPENIPSAWPFSFYVALYSCPEFQISKSVTGVVIALSRVASWILMWVNPSTQSFLLFSACPPIHHDPAAVRSHLVLLPHLLHIQAMGCTSSSGSFPTLNQTKSNISEENWPRACHFLPTVHPLLAQPFTGMKKVLTRDIPSH